MTSPILVVKEVQRIVVTAPGPQGPQGIPGSTFYYQHTQTGASSSWVVTHNLGAYPNVAVIISGEIVQADIIHSSVNQVNIVFPAPTSGVAVFS